MRLVWIVIALMLAAGALAAFKTRQAILESQKVSWQNDYSTRWTEETAAHNPTLWLPLTQDIAEKREPVRPFREPAPLSTSRLEARWRSCPADIVWDTCRDPRESGEEFAARASSDFTFMLAHFPERKD